MDDNENAAPEEAPVRPPVRRRRSVGAAMFGSLSDAIGRVTEAAAEEDAGAVETVPVTAPEEVQLLAPRKESNSIKAKISRALGIGNTMEEKKWRGLQMWRCRKCPFETFKADEANSHRC